MKIQETDLLWKLYLRYYRGEDIPEPKSLCPYFWKAVGGLLKVFFCDLALYVTLPLVTLAAVGYAAFIYYTMSGVSSPWIIFPTVAPALFLYLSIVILPFVHFIRWIESRPPTTQKRFFTTFFVATGVLLVYFVLRSEPKLVPNWREELLTGLMWVGVSWGLVVVGAVLYHCVICPAGVTRLGRQLILFLKSVKRGVCPLVDPPDGFKDRWKHCGDG